MINISYPRYKPTLQAVAIPHYLLHYQLIKFMLINLHAAVWKHSLFDCSYEDNFLLQQMLCWKIYLRYYGQNIPQHKNCSKIKIL